MKTRLDHVSASESGDYYQVLFKAEKDGAAYLLIQRQFEDPDRGFCYLESHDQDYIGHFKVVRARLERNRFCLKLGRKGAAEIEVTFRTTERNYKDIARIMRIMIPCLEVMETKDTC